MGSMLHDGYWSDENYTVGQEASLYQDAVAISEKMAFPIVHYTVSVQNLARLSKYKDEEFYIAQTIRMYDPEMKINDHGVVTKIVDHPDSPLSDSLEISTDVLNIGNKTFASILERVTEMAEKVRRGREIYERAAAISKDGTIKSDILEGAIDILKTRLLSTASNWRTDENGNIIMEALDGTSAMMLCGSGFMCANTKTDSGAWNWRTFGTGDGFTADMIITGYLNAERIEARSITVDHLSPNVGDELDLKTNTSIQMLDGKISFVVEEKEGTEGSSKTEFVLTETMISAISEQINIVADSIDLSANESITQSVNNALDGADISNNATIQMLSDSINQRVESTTFNEYTDSVETVTSNISQRADEIELSLEKKVDGETLRTYIRYEDGIVEIGRSDSRYTTHTSDSGFMVKQDGVEMTSMVKNTVSAPVMEARRQFQIGRFSIRTGNDGGLLFL